ncbi:MerR family transcriptional regulator [Luteitalea sp.]
MADSQSVTIPDKPAFKASEVCELAQIQPYVLRSWESEFPDLGLSKTPGGPRIYRRVDVERVLRIRDLVFVEGLTLSGVRRRFDAEQPPPQDDLFAFVAEVQAAQAKAAQAKTGAPRAEPAHEAPRPAPASAPVVTPASAPAAAAPSAPAPSGTTASPSTEEAPAGVPAVARETLVQIKQDMRSLLEFLSGEAAPGASPTARRGRRG